MIKSFLTGTMGKQHGFNAVRFGHSHIIHIENLDHIRAMDQKVTGNFSVEITWFYQTLSPFRQRQ